MTEQQAPKLYTHKPKKAQLKQFQNQNPSPATAPGSGGTPSSMASQSSSKISPPPQPPKESFARRYKFLWPLLLGVNFLVGAYFFTRTTVKKDVEGEVPSTTSTATVSSASVAEKLPTAPAFVEKVHEPIPEDQQRALLKWILEEKRKLKPKDPLEKRKIDEEKAMIKQLLRAKSFPSL